MIDIFDLFHLSKKEDIYTFCLCEFIKNDEPFRRINGKFWGFDNAEYDVFRGTIYTKNSNVRNKIIPDFIMFNSSKIVVVESKMYSSEGYSQTKDYESSKVDIVKALSEQNKDIDITKSEFTFYYFTLSGVEASSGEFTVVKWADFYYKVLENFTFADRTLDIIGQTIFQRAKEYKEFERKIKEQNYLSIIGKTNSWITPCSLFSSGMLNSEWKLEPAKEYSIYNGTVHGQGHSTFRTDISNVAKSVISASNDEMIYMFTRIEWNEDISVVVNMEYWKKDSEGNWIDYVPYSKLGKLQQYSDDLRSNCIQYLTTKLQNGVDGICVPTQKKNMLHMLKTQKPINTDEKTLGSIIDELKPILKKMEELKADIYGKMCIENGHIVFRT